MGYLILLLLFVFVLTLLGIYEAVAPAAAALTMPIVLFLRKRVSQPRLVVCGTIYFFITYFFLYFFTYEICYIIIDETLYNAQCVSDDWLSIDLFDIIFRLGIVFPALLYHIFFRVLIKIDRHGGDKSLQRRSRDMAAKEHDE